MPRTTLFTVDVHFGDCDPAGIVFFPNFSRWMDSASLAFFMACGVPPWRELVTLWRTFNLQIARVMAAIPEDVRLRAHDRHNLDRVAWRTIPAQEPATLDYFMRDYVGHLRHHLAQIEAMHPRRRQAIDVTTGSFARKFEAVNEHWSPRIVADLNGQHVKVVKLHSSPGSQSPIEPQRSPRPSGGRQRDCELQRRPRPQSAALKPHCSPARLHSRPLPDPASLAVH